jgi:cell division protein FtsQ
MKIDGVTVTRKKRKFRRNNVLYYLMAAILVVSLFAILASTVLFNVRSVVINHEGEPLYCETLILAAGGIEQGQNLMRFDSSQAGSDIMAALPRLDSVRVSRAFPSTVIVTVTNAQSAFSICDDGTYWEVSRGRRVINAAASRPDGLLVTGFVPRGLNVGSSLVSEPGDSLSDTANAELLFRLIALIERHDLAVSRIDLSDKFDIKLYYDGERIEIRLGEPLQLEEKIIVATRIITDEIAINENGVLRVTSPRMASFVPSTG